MSHFTDEERDAAIDYVLGEVAGGRGVKRVLREDAGKEGVPRLPDNATWWRWQYRNVGLSDQLARARESGVEAIVDEITDIADGKDDLPDADPAMRRVRIYAREKAAQLLKPRKYGPKMDLTSNGQTLGLADELAKRRRRAIEEREA